MQIPDDVTVTATQLSAYDGVTLAADHFVPQGRRPSYGVLIAPAMGVPRGYYRSFAAALAQGGAQVLVPDYRGIGGSGPAKQDASLRLWGEADLSAAAARLRAELPNLPLGYVGHSVGGQLFGLVQGAAFDAAYFVASQSGYWRGWPGLSRVGMWAFWHLVVPGLTAGYGLLPMRRFGQGEDVPLGVAREWASWGKHPRYMRSYADNHGGLGYARWSGPMRLISISDDGFAPAPTVDALASLYEAARTERVHLTPEGLGLKSLGHFGYFRPAHRETLWRDAESWLRTNLGLPSAAPRE